MPTSTFIVSSSADVSVLSTWLVRIEDRLIAEVVCHEPLVIVSELSLTVINLIESGCLVPVRYDQAWTRTSLEEFNAAAKDAKYITIDNVAYEGTEVRGEFDTTVSLGWLIS